MCPCICQFVYIYICTHIDTDRQIDTYARTCVSIPHAQINENHIDVCVYIYAHVYIQVSVPKDMYTNTSSRSTTQHSKHSHTVYRQTSKQANIHTYIHTRTHTYMHAYIHTYLGIDPSIYLPIHTYTCVCVCVYLYVSNIPTSKYTRRSGVRHIMADSASVLTSIHSEARKLPRSLVPETVQARLDATETQTLWP